MKKNDGFLSAAFLLILALIGACCSSRDPKFDQYYVRGEQLYLRHCANCHQKDGTGLGLVYPPLAQSDYMEKNFDSVVCLMKYGKTGELIVNGNSFNQPMPGVFSLTDLEIAEISTYIYNTWTHQRGLVDVKQVETITKTCEQ